MNPLLSIDPNVFRNLSPPEAVQAFRLLLCAEADRLHIPATSINVPAAVNVADGGIDATVETNAPLPPEGLICARHNRYQIKTGGTFKPWQEAALKKELFGDGKPVAKVNLGKAVRVCLDNGGRYVLVCFGQDVVAPNLDTAERLLRAELVECGYLDPAVAVLGHSHLLSLFERFPGLVRRFAPSATNGVRDHRSWSQDSEMARPFTLNAPHTHFIRLLQEALRNPAVKHIRVCGEPGIGKTRLVLEATRADDLQARVLYGNATDFLRDGLTSLLMDDTRLHVILIADECDQDSRALLVNRLAAHAPRIRVVSLYQDVDASGGITLLNPPDLDDAIVMDIIMSHELPKDVAQRWAPLCGGSPRVAHVVGENLRSNPEDVLKEASSTSLWNRFVQGARSADDPRAAQMRVILEHVALFQRFGFEQPVQHEARAIAAMVEAVDPSITWHRFAQLVTELRERRILQGERTLYITPKLLHIWLWSEWWEHYGTTFEINAFVSQLTGDLLRWFADMWRYAHRSRAAIRTVEKLLSPGGPFADGKLLHTETGSDFLLALTDASPEAVLACLERTVGAWSHDELMAFKTGRGSIRFALERIAIWESLFGRAARLLLALAAAENERWSNNATGVFAALYSPGRGRVAPTEASPERRFPVLVEALTSPDAARRSVGLKAARAALETDHFSRIGGAEYQGLKASPQLWMPKKWGEVFDAYRRVWRFLEDLIAMGPVDDRKAIASIMLDRTHGLIRLPTLSQEVVRGLRSLLERGLVTPKAVLQLCEDLLDSETEQIHPDSQAAIVALRDGLMDSGFSGRLHQYVGMRRREPLDNQEESERHWVTAVEDLADESTRSPDLLAPEWHWLVTTDAENAGRFGLAIGRRDAQRAMLQPIIEATLKAEDDRSVMLLAGYMSSVFQTDPEAWEDFLDTWAEDGTLTPLVAEVTWRSGMSDRALARLTNLLRNGRITARDLGVLRLGRVIEDVSEPVVRELIEGLLESSTAGGVSLALEMVHGYYERRTARNRELPADLAKRVLAD